MPKPSKHEIDESYSREGLDFDEEDEALLRHIFLDDAPPQGLHQRGVVKSVKKDDSLQRFQRRGSE